MEHSFLIFVAGSVLSYLPLYRLLERRWVSRVAYRRPNLLADKVSGPRREFLESLRQEAAIRARATILTAIATDRAQKRTGTTVDFDASTLKRLEETRDMVQPLLPAEVTSLLDRIIHVCSTTTVVADRSSVGAMMRQLDARLADVIGSTETDVGRPLRALCLASSIAV